MQYVVRVKEDKTTIGIFTDKEKALACLENNNSYEIIEKPDLEFKKLWEKPENASKNCPIASYCCDNIFILQYSENDFRPDTNHIMRIGESKKSFNTLEEAIAYVNSDEY